MYEIFLYVQKYMDRTQPMDRHVENMMTIHELTSAPPAAQMFGNAGIEHMNLYGETLSKTNLQL